MLWGRCLYQNEANQKQLFKSVNHVIANQAKGSTLLLRLLFAPDYEPLGIPMGYDGEDIVLPPEAATWPKSSIADFPSL